MAFDEGVLTIVADDGRAMPADLDTRLRPYLALVGATAVRVAAAPTTGDDRGKRWQTAQAHPLVRDLLKRFEGDVVSREVATRDEWLGRLERRP